MASKNIYIDLNNLNLHKNKKNATKKKLRMKPNIDKLQTENINKVKNAMLERIKNYQKNIHVRIYDKYFITNIFRLD